MITAECKSAAAKTEKPPSLNPSARSDNGNQTVRQLRHLGIQPKLRLGSVDDPAEREADRVAEQVMRMPAIQSTPAPAIKSLPNGQKSVFRSFTDRANATQKFSSREFMSGGMTGIDNESYLAQADFSRKILKSDITRTAPNASSIVYRQPSQDSHNNRVNTGSGDAIKETDNTEILIGEVKFSNLPASTLNQIAVINEEGGITAPPENGRWYKCDGFWYEPIVHQWFKIPDHCDLTVNEAPAINKKFYIEDCSWIGKHLLEPAINFYHGRSGSGPRWSSDQVSSSKSNPFAQSAQLTKQQIGDLSERINSANTEMLKTSNAAFAAPVSTAVNLPPQLDIELKPQNNGLSSERFDVRIIEELNANNATIAPPVSTSVSIRNGLPRSNGDFRAMMRA